MLHKIKINEIDDPVLFTLLGKTPPVVMLGSGISRFAPSNLPMGNQFSNSVLDFLLDVYSGKCTDPNPDLLKKILSDLPFEIINERCPNTDEIDKLLKNLYSSSIPNPVHELFAHLLLEQKIKSIITPNYDCCIDEAINKTVQVSPKGKVNRIIRVITEIDADLANRSLSPLLFKIHGSSDDTSGESLVFRLNQEGVIPPWKRKLFRRILNNETFLLIGYSGKDFDLCPEIELANPRQLIWNFYSEKEVDDSVNIKQLSVKYEIFALIGDMRDLLSRLYAPIIVSDAINNIDIVFLLNKAFDENTKKLWRIRILNSINYNKSALKETNREILENHEFSLQISFLSEHAGALASSGKYLEAAKTHDLASNIALNKGNSIEMQTTQILNACDAWRCYGSFLKSYIRLIKAKNILKKMDNPPKDLEVLLVRNQILLLRHPFEFFWIIRLSFITQKIQNLVANLIHTAISFYRENGDWYQLQQMGLWRERFRLNEDIALYDSEYSTPLSNDGYRQLNFLMGKMMAFRHHIKLQNRLLTEEEIAQAHDLISDANALGIIPEVWKLNLLIIQKSLSKQRNKNEIKGFIDAFWQCQYSLFFRIWRLVLGD